MSTLAEDLGRAKILVVGATGFLGHPIVRRLVDLGADVTAVSPRPEIAIAAVEPQLDKSRKYP